MLGCWNQSENLSELASNIFSKHHERSNPRQALSLGKMWNSLKVLTLIIM